MKYKIITNICSINALSKIKVVINVIKYVINLDEYESKRANCIALYVNENNVIYFDSFGVEHIPKVIKKFIGNKNITTDISRIQAYDSTVSGYSCIIFIDFMLKGKSVSNYTNSLSPNEYEKND